MRASAMRYVGIIERTAGSPRRGRGATLQTARQGIADARGGCDGAVTCQPPRDRLPERVRRFAHHGRYPRTGPRSQLLSTRRALLPLTAADAPAPAAQPFTGQVADQIANTPRNTRVRSPRSCYPYCMISPIRGDRTGIRVQVPPRTQWVTDRTGSMHERMALRVRSALAAVSALASGGGAAAGAGGRGRGVTDSRVRTWNAVDERFRVQVGGRPSGCSAAGLPWRRRAGGPR